MDANQYKSDLKRSNRFGSPSTSRVSSPSYPYFLNQSTRSKFIGSFIHEYNVDSRVKHRPSKRARQRIRKRLAKLELDDNGGSKASPESGYETTSGDCQTPGFASPALNKTSFKLPEDSHNKAKRDSNRPRSVEGSLPSAKDDNDKKGSTVYSRTTSVSGISSVITDKTLRRLLKDLQRCEVSIVKYEAMLSNKCQEGQAQLKDVFSKLRYHIDIRETDLREELIKVHDNAAAILERRKNTALYLKQAAEKVASLEEAQVEELKQQIKQFVTDRRVDEEIGTITRLQAEPDDIVPHILGFGKVNNVHHMYTEWEENPGEAIEMSKHRLSFLTPINSSFTISTESEDSPTHSVASQGMANTKTDSSTSLQSEKKTFTSPKPTPEQLSKDSPTAGGRDSSEHRSVSGREVVSQEHHVVVDNRLDRINEQNVNKTLSTHVMKTVDEPEQKLILSKKDQTDEEEGEINEKKLSTIELLEKQARVRESLKMQGVFLYDPLTGRGPPPIPLTQAKPTETSTVRDKPPLSPGSRKKKTPTQLRRERKKRQKERERRQIELGKRTVCEESLANKTSSLSSGSKSPEVPTTDKSSSISLVDEADIQDSSCWVVMSPSDTARRDERNVSNENSESEETPVAQRLSPDLVDTNGEPREQVPSCSEGDSGANVVTLESNNEQILVNQDSEPVSSEENLNIQVSENTTECLITGSNEISSSLSCDTNGQSQLETISETLTNTATTSLIEVKLPTPPDNKETLSESPVPVPSLKQLATIAATSHSELASLNSPLCSEAEAVFTPSKIKHSQTESEVAVQSDSQLSNLSDSPSKDQDEISIDRKNKQQTSTSSEVLELLTSEREE